MHRFFPKKRNTVSVFSGRFFFDGTDLKGALTARVSFKFTSDRCVGVFLAIGSAD